MEHTMQEQFVIINDAALGAWKICVDDVCKQWRGGYTFEVIHYAVDLHTNEVCNDRDFLAMLGEYATEEGYVEQNINAQCEVLFDAAIERAQLEGTY